MDGRVRRRNAPYLTGYYRRLRRGLAVVLCVIALLSVVVAGMTGGALAADSSDTASLTGEIASSDIEDSPELVDSEIKSDSISLTFSQAVNATSETAGLTVTNTETGTELEVQTVSNSTERADALTLSFVSEEAVADEDLYVMYTGDQENIVASDTGQEVVSFQTTVSPDNGTLNDEAASTDEIDTVVYSFESDEIVDQVGADVQTETTEATGEGEIEGGEIQDDPETVDTEEDDRTRVTDPWDHSHEPYQATVQLETADGGVCTGTLVGDFQVLTAAHCVFDQENDDWANSVTARPATDRYEWAGPQIKPYSEADVQIARTYSTFVEGDSGDCTASDSCPIEDDFALLTLDRSIGDRTHTHQMDWRPYGADDPVYEEAFVSVQGYPGNPPNNEPYPSMWFDAGDAQGEYCAAPFVCNEDALSTDLTTSGGQSGAAIYHYNSDLDRYEILAVVKGVTEEETIGPRITYGKSSDLFTWIQEDRDGEYVDPPDDKPNYVFDDFKFTGEEANTIDIEPTDDVVLGESEVTFEHTVRNVGTETEDTAHIHMYTAEGDGSCDIENRDEFLDSESFSAPGSYQSTEATVSTTLPEHLGSGTTELCALVISDPDDDEFIEHFDYRYSDTISVTTIEPSEFDVEIDSADTFEGEIFMDYEVENIGDAVGDGEVVVEYNGREQCSESFTLEGGETESGLCDYEIQDGDDDEITIAVISPDGNRDETTVEPEPAEFDVAIDTVDDPVVAGEGVSVTIDVENLGDKHDTQEAILSTNGDTCESESVSLTGGSETTVQLECTTTDEDSPELDLIAESDDDTDTTVAEVNQPAQFGIAIDGTTITDGTLSVEYAVENTGDISGDTTVDLKLEDDPEDDRTHHLEAGETDSDTFEYDLEHGDEPELAVSLETPDDEDDTTVDVEPATVELNAITTDEPIVEGESLEVTASVTNMGDEPSDESLELRSFDGTVVDDEPVEIDGGGSADTVLTWETSEGVTGTDDITVESESDDRTAGVTILESAKFEPTIDAQSETVAEGEDVLEVDATIENTGEQDGTQDIVFLVNGEEIETKSELTVDAGESEAIAFEYESEVGDGPELELAIETADETTTQTVDVDEQADFNVAIDETNDPVVEGDTLAIDTAITNDGDFEDRQDIVLEIDGEEVDRRENLELDGGDDSTEELSYETEADDAGELEVVVSSDDDDAQTAATVNAPANFEVTIEDYDVTVVEGGTLTLETTIENTGEAPDEQDVVLTLDEEPVDETSGLELDGEESQQVTFEQEIDDEPGEVEVGILTEDDSEAVPVEILEPPVYSVDIDGTNEPVEEGDRLEVETTVTNDGEAAGERLIILTADGEAVKEKAVDIEPDESTTITLGYETEHGDAPSADLEVLSPDDSETTTADIEEVPFFAVSDVDSTAPVDVGETVKVTATIENTGDGIESQTVWLYYDDDRVDERESLELGGDDSESVTFEYDTTSADVPTTNLTVATEDTDETIEITVDEPPLFDIEVIESPDTVVVGESITLTATVDNEGTLEDTQTIELLVGDERVNETELTLVGQESDTITVSEETARDTPEETVNVSLTSEDTEETVAVDIVEPEPANVVINSVQAPTAVPAGDDIELIIDVENEGDLRADHTLTTTASDLMESQVEDPIDLEGGTTDEMTVTLPTEPEDEAIETEITVDTGDDTEERTVTIDEPTPATFEIDAFEHADPIEATGSLSVNATIQNTGTVAGSQNVTLLVDDEVVDETTLSIDADSHADVGFEVDSLESGERDLTLETANETVSSTVEVNEASDGGGGGGAPSLDPAFIEVTFSETPDEIDPDETVDVQVTAANVGDATATQELTLYADGSPVDTDERMIPSNNQRFVSFSFSADDVDGESVELMVESADDEESIDIETAGTDSESEGDTEADDESEEAADEADDEADDTADESETPEQETDDDTSEGDDDVPGFGVTVAILGLLGAAVVARIRG